jgi:membrane protease YdiL (CAAX protease family)
MKRSLAFVTVIDFIFILLLAASGLVGGILSDAVYYLAFAVPIVLTLALRKRLGIEYNPPRVTVSREGLGLTFASAAPILTLVFLVSYLTSLLLSRFGEGNLADVSGNLFLVLLTHAVITPILEEVLFRYIPIALLSGYSRRGAMLYSAAFFALAHCNLYQLPYAFLAGIIFAAADIAFDSILPSVILHALNNFISVLWLRYAADTSFMYLYLIVLFSLAIVSLPIIFLLRRRFFRRVTDLISGDGRIPPSAEAFLFIAITLTMAIVSL